MRGGFNDTLTAKYGERSRVGQPGLAWAFAVPCRKVLQREVVQRQFPFTLTRYWVTLDAVALNGAFSSSPWLGAVFSDYEAADLVSFGSDPDRWYYVCRAEKVFPYGRPAYTRYLLLPLESLSRPPWPPPVSPPPPPSPPPPITPGATCSTAPVIGLNQGVVVPYAYGFEDWIAVDKPEWVFHQVQVVGGTSDMVVTGFHGSCSDLVSIAGRVGPGCFNFYHYHPGGGWIRVFFPALRAPYALLIRNGSCA